MDETLRNLLLVLCGFGALGILGIMYIWYFVFGRSLQAVLMAGLSILMNRDMHVDLNAPLDIKKRPEQAKSEIKARASSMDFDSAVTSKDKYVPYIAGDEPENEFSAQAVEVKPNPLIISTTAEKNRFRRLSEIVTHPFLGHRWNPQNNSRNENVNLGSDSSDSE